MSEGYGGLPTCLVCPVVHGGGVRCWYVVPPQFYTTRSNHSHGSTLGNSLDANASGMDLDGILSGDTMEELAGIEHHPLVNQYPCRTPVWWARTGDVHKDPNLRGVSGRRIVLRIPKQFGRIEGKLASILRAPRELRRPLDGMNSMLWELADGSRTFGEICQVMNEMFRETIAPVMQRTAAAIQQMMNNNLMLVIEEPLLGRWFIGPGKTPEHQVLDELPEDHAYDWSLMENETP